MTPAPTNDAAPAYLEPLRAEMAETEKLIGDFENQLIELRKKRTALGRALSVLDPQWAAEHEQRKPSTKKKTYAPPAARKDAFFAELAAEFNDGETFTAQQINDKNGTHLTTIHKLLKDLHSEGRIQLDHLGGQRKTTKFYRVPQT